VELWFVKIHLICSLAAALLLADLARKIRKYIRA
jgi:hypothetical protein